ncbi:helix-turn-helix transcriptional regulator [Paenibacillus puerhi]|uniref:helix-turn-helix transcriptional regulator n=1 Tax=Paenibacillus puerhi TaxID=2692622 RepID=UPI0013582CCF|nr:AraC family transcriptional regulator [Paenibacillus puerhi]
MNDSAYPLNMFRNRCKAGEMGRSALYLHWHDHFEWIYMVSGRAVFHIDTLHYEAQPEDLLLVPRGSLHVGYAAVEEEVEYWSLVFNPSMLGGMLGDPVHDHYLAPFLEGKLRFPVHYDSREPEFQAARDIMRLIKREYEHKPRAYELVVKAQLYLLFSLLARRYLPERGMEPLASADKRMERFKSLILHIQANFGDKLTLSEASQFVNLTPYHFCKVFKSATGRTFVDFVNRIRMDEAERLLRTGSLTVTEVAERVGCGNLNYFTKLFKQIKGTTPSIARKNGEGL